MGEQKRFCILNLIMADQQRRRRGGARKFTYRGLELDELLKLNQDSLYQLFRARIRRKLNRSKGFKGKYVKLLEKLRVSKKNLQPGEKLYCCPRDDRKHCRCVHWKRIQTSRS